MALNTCFSYRFENFNGHLQIDVKNDQQNC